ncbi:unnamed protein product [Bursaphelenchus okinawaensis]|uniref:Uncharacterized protein n=1 Tax=Bursaphelenchus okinawaensis TaxID=465554 RepID=A0A811L9W1_9BILA|nr:unnamed protein product [Bursaphelenchus okinawaensis]CAG9119536.1 unnamed protein product [Bursaphelenchus okinawaensis]
MSDGECELHENESESSPPSFALFAPMVFILINIGLLISVSVMVYRIRKAQAQFRNLVEKLLNTSLNRGIGQRSQNKVQQYVRNPENNMIKYIQHITP